MKDRIFKIHSKKKEDNKFLRRINADAIADLLYGDVSCEFEVTEIKTIPGRGKRIKKNGG